MNTSKTNIKVRTLSDQPRPAKDMAKRGQQPTSDGSGALKKNKSDQRQPANQRNNRPRSVPPNNTGQTNRKNSENPGRAVENNSGTRSKKNKPPSLSQNKSNRNHRNAPGREKLPWKQQQKKLLLQFGFAADPTLSTRHNASITLAITPTWYYFSRPSNLAFHDFTKRHKPEKNYDHYWDLD